MAEIEKGRGGRHCRRSTAVSSPEQPNLRAPDTNSCKESGRRERRTRISHQVGRATTGKAGRGLAAERGGLWHRSRRREGFGVWLASITGGDGSWGLCEEDGGVGRGKGGRWRGTDGGVGSYRQWHTAEVIPHRGGAPVGSRRCEEVAGLPGDLRTRLGEEGGDGSGRRRRIGDGGGAHLGEDCGDGSRRHGAMRGASGWKKRATQRALPLI